ncbi:unnamed protein product [Phyllotreta striolata]|uniref:Zinc finger CCHC domain-containing protein 4 n=1 Tax=Phyllotreta striolata TaxID=444603 RepID=A0A9N9U0W7_PHYSR|nr:unnamed protein product [Phyllotreta striolata]
MSKTSTDVVVGDIDNNPHCPHGPTVLFSKASQEGVTRYFACSACRDRKNCKFYVLEDQRDKYNKAAWDKEIANFKKDVHHRQMYINYHKTLQSSSVRWFCNNCNKLSCEEEPKHLSHSVVKYLSLSDLEHPSKILPPLDDSKKEAQYHFSDLSVRDILRIFMRLGYRNVICIGAPRIHECIKNNHPNLSSILLDIDKRYHNFSSPLEYCWYNMFNHHFFFTEAKDVFETFLQTDRGKGMVLITDPPFGGRTEMLSATFKRINEDYKRLNKTESNLPMFWIYPYFMEPQIVNYMPDFAMSDYKVDYENHCSFQNSRRGKIQGSPIRIFTNVNLSLIELPPNEYRFCNKCSKWVGKENKHCDSCGACTSKNGETYVHCYLCNRCVKPAWVHCQQCNRCAQLGHTCSTINFSKDCFYCKERGHKQADCPLLSSDKKPVKKGTTKSGKQKKRKPSERCNKLKKKLKQQ